MITYANNDPTKAKSHYLGKKSVTDRTPDDDDWQEMVPQVVSFSLSIFVLVIHLGCLPPRPLPLRMDGVKDGAVGAPKEEDPIDIDAYGNGSIWLGG